MPISRLVLSNDPEPKAFLNISRIWLGLLFDSAAIVMVLYKILMENPNVVADYKSGKQGVIGFLVGKVMKETGGKANPKLVNETLKQKLR